MTKKSDKKMTIQYLIKFTPKVMKILTKFQRSQTSIEKRLDRLEKAIFKK
jgi:hypothetical protein